MHNKAQHIIIFVVLLVFFTPAIDSLNATNLDSLQLLVEKYEKDGLDEELMDAHHQIGDYYFYEKEYVKAVDAYSVSLDLAQKASNEEIVANNLYKIGVMYTYQQNTSSSLEYLLKGYDLMRSAETPNLKQIGKTLKYASKAYQKIGNFELAYDYQLRALEVFEGLKDTSNIAISLYELGNVFFYQEQFSAAIEKYDRSRELASKMNIKGLVIATIGSMGSAYDRMEQVEKSLEYNLMALNIAEENGLESQQADALHNIASSYHTLGYCEEALINYEKALRYKRKHNNEFGEVGTLRGMSSVYLDLGEIQKAISYLKQALKIAESIKSDTRRMDVYQRMATAYEQNGSPLQACKYMKAYMSLKDSVMNQNTLEAMTQAKTRYEVEKREKEITVLKKENELLEKNREIAALRGTAFLGLALGLLFLLGVFWYYDRNQKRYSKLLEEKAKHIELQNAQLEEANAQLEEINQSQKDFNNVLTAKNEQIEKQNIELENANIELKQFAYVASHDLKEPLRMISSYTSLIQRRYAKHLDESGTEFMGYITDATRRMNNLLNDLLAYSRISTHNQQKEEINMNEVLEGILANLQLAIQQKNAKIRLHNLPTVKANRSQIGQLYQNLISNAIKFSDHEHPEIDISAQTNGKMHVFSVKDNGIGISPEHQQKIFEMFSRLHTRQEYEGTGIGLATCKKIVERHGGIIWVESKKNEGSTFYFTLPFEKKSAEKMTISSSLENINS